MVTADDCGLSRGINRATLDLFQKGIVTGADVMTNFSATQHAVELFAPQPTLKIGVHLNLSDGSALQIRESSPLTGRDARFRSRSNLFVRALIPSPAFLSLTEKELAAQINVLIRNDLKPEHLSTHIQFHLFPALREIVFKLARDYDAAWVRPYRLRNAVLPFNPLWRWHSPLSPVADREPTRGPGYIVVLKYWMGHRPQELWDVLESLPGVVELVVHPCLPQDDSFPDHVDYSPAERFKETLYLEQWWQLKH